MTMTAMARARSQRCGDPVHPAAVPPFPGLLGALLPVGEPVVVPGRLGGAHQPLVAGVRPRLPPPPQQHERPGERGRGPCCGPANGRCPGPLVRCRPPDDGRGVDDDPPPRRPRHTSTGRAPSWQRRCPTRHLRASAVADGARAAVHRAARRRFSSALLGSALLGSVSHRRLPRSRRIARAWHRRRWTAHKTASSRATVAPARNAGSPNTTAHTAVGPVWVTTSHCPPMIIPVATDVHVNAPDRAGEQRTSRPRRRRFTRAVATHSSSPYPRPPARCRQRPAAIRSPRSLVHPPYVRAWLLIQDSGAPEVPTGPSPCSLDP